jgi:maleylacetoacetate isomerase
MSEPILYHYWRSSSSWRVRWGLAEKGIAYRAVAIDLRGGDQRSDAHRQRNPLAAVPVLHLGGIELTQSVAILEYLEETQPTPPLLPHEPLERAAVRQLVQVICADTQPLQNLSVLQRVGQLCGGVEAATAWATEWIGRGLDGYEALLGKLGSPGDGFSLGGSLSLADLCLLPQCYNARRQGIDINRWPRIAAIEAHCLQREACQRSHPDAFAE